MAEMVTKSSFANKSQKIYSWLRFLIPAVVLVLGVFLHIQQPPIIEDIELKTFDFYQRIKPRAFLETSVRIIDLDDETLSRIGQWPWSRTRVAELVEKLDHLGAAVISFDIVFAEPDRTTPARIIDQIPEISSQPDIAILLHRLPDNDDLLANAIKKSTVVTGFSWIPTETDTLPAVRSGFGFAGDDPTSFLFEFPGAVTNLQKFSQAADGNGSFTVIPERDGIIRRIPLFFKHQKQIYPSLVASTLRVLENASTFIIKSSGASGTLSFGEQTGISEVKIGSHRIPTDQNGRIWLYDTGYRPERFIPAWQIMKGTVDPTLIRDHVVLIGTSAAGLKDIRSTPLNPVAPGVEINAQLTEQILTGIYLNRPDWSLGAEMIYMIVFGLALIFLLPRFGALLSAMIGFISIAAAILLSWYMFSAHHLLLAPVYPSFLILLIYLSTSLLNYLKTESERSHFRNAFSRYLAPSVVETLSKNPDRLRLGGELKEMTFLFADIRHFTTISENFHPEELTRFMNSFLTPMTDTILQHQGTIDKYMGDCIMAFWNAPLDDPQHARHACHTALDMCQRLQQFNTDFTKTIHSKLSSIEIGIGVNTGECCVGNFGSDQRFDYSVIGDEVNLASRLESQSKTYGINIVVGQNTYAHIQDYATIELDLLQVQGKSIPIHIYGLIGPPSLNLEPYFSDFHNLHKRFIEAYRGKDWDVALDLIHKINIRTKPFGNFELFYRLYQDRIRYYQEHPPKPDWKGVFTAQTK
ncbi:MAG: adenylate/guanylate cyclase domain-containing protein [Candidatus Omnitrophica bacterium]|nr:adenylate/guanylate cyclase domain-containing protein [Candidatus Omnitrophota bacterium]